MEMVDLYDENRLPLGRTAERYAPKGEGEYRVVVHICVFDSRGRLLIQQRSREKAVWPEAWDALWTVGRRSISGCCRPDCPKSVRAWETAPSVEDCGICGSAAPPGTREREAVDGKLREVVKLAVPVTLADHEKFQDKFLNNLSFPERS